MEGYRHFRKNRKRREGASASLFVNDYLECIELYPEMDKESGL